MVIVYMCMSLFVSACTHSSVCVAYGWRSPWRPEEGVETVGAGITGSCELSTWVVETKSGSSAKGANILNHCAISPPQI